MAFQWIKSNWSILSATILLGVSGTVAVRDMQHDVASINDKISEMQQKAEERSQIADRFYQRNSDENLPMRVKALEALLQETRDQIRQYQQGQIGVFNAIADLKSDIRVVSSKVDDLRDQPRKTSFDKVSR